MMRDSSSAPAIALRTAAKTTKWVAPRRKQDPLPRTKGANVGVACPVRRARPLPAMHGFAHLARQCRTSGSGAQCVMAGITTTSGVCARAAGSRHARPAVVTACAGPHSSGSVARNPVISARGCRAEGVEHRGQAGVEHALREGCEYACHYEYKLGNLPIQQRAAAGLIAHPDTN